MRRSFYYYLLRRNSWAKKRKMCVPVHIFASRKKGRRPWVLLVVVFLYENCCTNANACSLPKLFFSFFDFDVCRFCTSKRCFGYFRLWSAMRVLVEVFVHDWEKTSFGGKFWEAPWSTETKHVLVNPKRLTKTWLLPQYCWVCLFCKFILLFGK